MIPTGQHIPENLKAGLDRYATNHIRTGGFLEAVLNNDLFSAMAKADPDSLLFLHDIVGYCYNELPGDCWGSPEKVRAWLSTPKNDMPDNPELYYNERAEAMFDTGRDRD